LTPLDVIKMSTDEERIQDALARLPIAYTAPDWVEMMVDAWNDANDRVIQQQTARGNPTTIGMGLTIDDSHAIANSLLIADGRTFHEKLGGRHSRIVDIQKYITFAWESLFRLDFNMFYYYCEMIEKKYAKSTIREALRKLVKQS
jgi:hypothetical protein